VAGVPSIGMCLVRRIFVSIEGGGFGFAAIRRADLGCNKCYGVARRIAFQIVVTPFFRVNLIQLPCFERLIFPCRIRPTQAKTQEWQSFTFTSQP